MSKFKSLLGIGFTVLIASIFISQYNKYKIKNSNPRFNTQQQIEIIKKVDNLYPNGTVTTEGWARKAFWTFKRDYINSFSLFIKEWDYYITFIEELNIFIAVTVTDLGYAGMYSVQLIDCNKKKYNQIDEKIMFPMGKLKLPNNSLVDHKINYKGKTMEIEISKEKEVRKIKIKSSDFKIPDSSETGLDLEFIFNQPKDMESMNIQTTWQHNRNLFYLNEKVNGMEVTKGYYKIGNKIKEINDKTKNIFTTLDWGRGVWKYEGTWYWSSATGMVDKNKIGFNLGYGFSDRSVATENVLFINDKIEKINIVSFIIPDNEKSLCDSNKPWDIKSDDDKINAKFYPDVDRTSNMNFILIKSDQHQVFGIFKGYIKLNNGNIIKFDNLKGFAEKVFNRW